MPESRNKRFSNSSFEGKRSLKRLKHDFDGPEKAEQLFMLPRGLSNSRLQKTRMTIEAPAKSNLKPFSTEHPKLSGIKVNKLARSNTSLINRTASTASVLGEEIMQKENTSSRFLSLLVDRGRMIKHRAIRDHPAGRIQSETEEAERLSHANKLLLLQALRRGPLPFLDLHALFGVSKQTIRRLVKKGLLCEAWGPKAVGLRFKLSEKGRSYLNQLEAASKYDSKTARRDFVRVKNKAFF